MSLLDYALENKESSSEINESIHPTALIDPAAVIKKNVTIGPYSIIGPNVNIDEGTVIGSNVRIEGWTSIGKRNEIFSGAVIGNKPQDLKYNGEKSFVEIGDNNLIREYVTINRGTIGGGCLTRIGNNNLLMTSSHIAHDAIIFEDCVIGHGSLIGGHAVIGKGATIAVLSGVHQFCRVGDYAMIGGGTMVAKDVVPYTIVKGSPPRLRGLNKERLKRLGLSDKKKKHLQQAFKLLFRSSLILSDALHELKKISDAEDELNVISDFFKQSMRGTYR